MKTIKLSFALIVFVLLAAGKSIKPGYKIGDSVQDFKLKNVNGTIVSLSDYKMAKGYIVIFDSNTCPYSKAYNARIIKLNKKYAALGFPVIAINANDPTISPGDSFEKMEIHAQKKKYAFPYLFDETQEIAKAYGATNTPQAFVLYKQEGVNKLVYAGSIDDNARDPKAVKTHYLEDAVDALLAGKKVPVSRTKAIGCTIKWRHS